MSDPRKSLAAIVELPLRAPVRVLNLCGDQERVISLSEMRRQLPRQVQLVSGPGCAASVCPETDLYQAMQLVERHAVTLWVADNLLRLPIGTGQGQRRSLADAMRDGADIRPVTVPMEAVIAARERPERDMVLFVAGFETLLVPLAGMVLEGLPDNLSILLCGRRSEPLVEHLIQRNAAFDAMLLPGNRCALTGTDDWERLADAYRKPAAVAGYTAASILAALHAVLQQHEAGEARVDNFYRSLARAGGNSLARDQLQRVFELVEGDWRGLGGIGATAFRLRHAYDPVNADARYPDYRDGLPADWRGMPPGCECAGVLTGGKSPLDCALFAKHCTPLTPVGPCMASEDAACFLSRTSRNAA